ncbi:hypothetical protein ACFE33_03875 [Falsihalocynthiibacter sp. SS001]|uniref:hypothetical protein n=1 Tax=Falsihalocynthiibacter sp. SS001 TaxID=3349698 RepID=UPI0036D42434
MFRYLPIGFITASVAATVTLKVSDSLLMALLAYSGAGALTVLLFCGTHMAITYLLGKHILRNS